MAHYLFCMLRKEVNQVSVNCIWKFKLGVCCCFLKIYLFTVVETVFPLWNIVWEEDLTSMTNFLLRLCGKGVVQASSGIWIWQSRSGIYEVSEWWLRSWRRNEKFREWTIKASLGQQYLSKYKRQWFMFCSLCSNTELVLAGVLLGYELIFFSVWVILGWQKESIFLSMKCVWSWGKNLKSLVVNF